MRTKLLVAVVVFLAVLLGAFGIWRTIHTKQEKANRLQQQKMEEFFKKRGELETRRRMLAGRIYFQEQVIQQFPDSIDARLTLAKLYIEVEEQAKAKAVLETILKKEPNHPEATRLHQGLP